MLRVEACIGNAELRSDGQRSSSHRVTLESPARKQYVIGLNAISAKFRLPLVVIANQR